MNLVLFARSNHPSGFGNADLSAHGYVVFGVMCPEGREGDVVQSVTTMGFRGLSKPTHSEGFLGEWFGGGPGAFDHIATFSCDDAYHPEAPFKCLGDNRFFGFYEFEEFQQAVLEREFEALRLKWRDEISSAMSFSSDIMANCASYRQIMAYGMRVVPLILRQMQAEGGDPDHWFWALRVITNENPVPHEHRGMIVEMARDWIAWGKRKGIIA